MFRVPALARYMSLPALRIPARSGTPDAAVIFLHGLGDSSDGWLFFPLMALQRPSDVYKNINFVFPQAPTRPITVNGGHRMTGWFDIYQFGTPDGPKDTEGLVESVGKLQKYVEEQVLAGIRPERILVGGFSQGAAVSLSALPLSPELGIGGVIALSGFVPVREHIELVLKVKDAVPNTNVPVFQGHGTADPVIAYQYGEMLGKFLKTLGYELKFHGYPGVVHSASEEELNDVFEFIERVLV